MYKRKFGPREEPPEDQEPSNEQLVCLQCVIKGGQVPFVDMAVWGPYGGRLYRKNKLRGSVFKSDGSFGSQEIFGPPDIDAWVACWKVFRCAMIMLDAVDLGVLDKYQDLIVGLHTMYGSSVWLQLYQADV